jgi:hypothetical protein
MRIDYFWDAARERLQLTAHGSVTLEDLVAVTERQAADGYWRSRVLYDARQRTGPALTPSETKTLIALVESLSARHGPPGPTAILVADTAGYGVGLMYAIFGDSIERTIEIFTDLDTAERWLDRQTGA